MIYRFCSQNYIPINKVLKYFTWGDKKTFPWGVGLSGKSVTFVQ